jgi:hypothetical protein
MTNRDQSMTKGLCQMLAGENKVSHENSVLVFLDEVFASMMVNT